MILAAVTASNQLEQKLMSAVLCKGNQQANVKVTQSKWLFMKLVFN